ncbi:hypothetical protein M153_2940001027 [Pseudoloma neurophilia]|uniref:Uncharacterized protein n=1 Tax=Pseudoloma neurophilia TaxID=146866 RepID=A0A0R0M5J2_9MICR|nr:hypothetical protein M153_2940001027 [Pseudoloma neurophilia]
MNPTFNKKLLRFATEDTPSRLYERHLSALSIKHGTVCSLI